jgi:hypothetical protein
MLLGFFRRRYEFTVNVAPADACARVSDRLKIAAIRRGKRSDAIPDDDVLHDIGFRTNYCVSHTRNK